jgi:D-sedoheptulose 7-phosphate isomerase
MSDILDPGRMHLAALERALVELRPRLAEVDDWGARLAADLTGGARLLVAGNGGSAAHAQHLTAELVGRFREERRPLSAVALHAETSALTAIVNDYGPEEAFARQVRAHGRPGDTLLLISTSGRSANLIAAADAAHDEGLGAWALSGTAPNPLADVCDQSICVDAGSTATIQEVHQVIIHLLCQAIDGAVGPAAPATRLRVAG